MSFPRFFHPFARLTAALGCAAVVGFVPMESRASGSFLQDFSGTGSTELPVWMAGPPMATPARHATVSFPIRPPATEDDLLVTVFFHERKGGFLRVYWDDGYNKEMLCENLAEGVGMLNRRTLRIRRPVMVSEGMLTFQSSEEKLGVERIFWQWSRLQPAYLDDTVLPGGFMTRTGWLSDDEIDGYVPTRRSDAWMGAVVTAPIAQQPERMEKGLEFVAEMTDLPKRARVRVRVSGLPAGADVQLLLNGRPAGSLQVPVPDLTDPGWTDSAGGGTRYIGWQEATLLVEGTLFREGDNQFQFVSVPAAPEWAVKDFDIQLFYP